MNELRDESMSNLPEKRVLGSDPHCKVGKTTDRLHGVWINQLISRRHWRRVSNDSRSTLKKEFSLPNKTTVTEEFASLCANNSMSSIIVDQQKI